MDSIHTQPKGDEAVIPEQWVTRVGDVRQSGNEIVRVTCGSGVHGMAIEGHDDNDEMGVYIADADQVLGVTKLAGHFTARTQPMGARSGPGDTDLSLYSLQHYMRLALAGNPTVLTVLFAPSDAVLSVTPLGHELRELAPFIVSRHALWRHLGYLNGQRERMAGGGRRSRVPNRPELIAAHGYDTKYASHALRLGLQGIELATVGRLVLPMTPEHLAPCMAIKRGEVSFEDALAQVDRVAEQLRWHAESSRGALRREPDLVEVNDWMIEAHMRFWRS